MNIIIKRRKVIKIVYYSFQPKLKSVPIIMKPYYVFYDRMAAYFYYIGGEGGMLDL